MKRSLHHVLFVALLTALFSSDATAFIFRVGSDIACTHNTIQGAIQASLGNGTNEDTIRLSNNQTYNNQRLVVLLQSVKIVGGYESCSGSLTGTRTVINGNGNHSIIEILGDTGTQETVTLANLDMSGGGADVDHGGAIQVSGRNRVFIENVTIHDNQSARGAGIYFNGSGGGRVIIWKDTLVGGFNQASEAGGGIYCKDAPYTISAPLVIDDASVGFNSAPVGGGIYLDNCYFQAFSRSTNYGLYFNEASSSGGAIYAINGSTAYTDAGSITGTPAQWNISGNRAVTGGGGAVALDASTGIFGDTRMASNRALSGSGGGVFAANSSTVRFQVDLNNACTGSCSQLHNNQAAFGGGIKADKSDVTIKQTLVTGNQASRASAVFVFNGTVEIHGTVFAANSGADVVTEFGLASTRIRYSTFADNLNQVLDVVASSGGDLTVLSSIFHEAQGSVLSVQSGIPLDVRCVLTHDATGLPAISSIRADDPMFIDRANGNYHLSSLSPAIDFCSNLAGDERDIDHQNRGVDHTGRTDLFGTYDLGADEFDDLIFLNGFE